MPIHVSLDYTVPFQVGDEVFTSYPAGNGEFVGGPASYPSFKGTISSVKLMFALGPTNSCTITESIDNKELTVEKVVYTVVPSHPSHQSAFMVECGATSDSDTKLFSTEAELLAYQEAKP
ncbi:hypothetical protein [Spirosoma utsteinense]|uniref:Uncharacterized protein n=1 Tax=Spirosoma utsteinense TaxID=2585773 RepID=A0ABR6WDB8_9BACT|nr:hypothetical protein [Spirosoma utsteinense]MBC3787429.1 hypothetical protein [Spirosoma utsteinense]MBC3794551.1 hypothetical protein [Spirosoma utsteinense]